MKITRFFTTLVVAFFTVINAFAQLPDGVYYTHDNKKIFTYEDGTYKDEAGNEMKRNFKDYRFYISGDNSLYLCVDARGNKEQVVSFNDRYILTLIYNAKKLYSVWDREYNEVEKNINVNYSVKKREQILKETVFKYFKDCEPLQKALLSYDGGAMGTSDFRSEPIINYYNCGNAPDLILENGVKSPYLKEVLIIGKPDPDEFGINNKGEKVFFYQSSSLLKENTFNYYAKYGTVATTSSKTADWKTIRRTSVNKIRTFKHFKTEEGKLMMHVILVFSDKYVLTSDFDMKDFDKRNRFFIHDRQGNLVEKLFTEDKLLEMFDKYFKEYPELKEVGKYLKKPGDKSKNSSGIEDVLNYIKLGESTPDMMYE